MDDKLFEKLDDLNIVETNSLLEKDINLLLNSSTRKRIETSVMKKTGYYEKNNIFKYNITDLLGGIIMKRKIALVLSATVVLGLGGGGYAYAKTPVAYVSVDINPSVELGVNAFDQVVSVEAYNEDGEKVLEGTDLINTDVDDAVSTVIENAISEGYIKDDDTITADAADKTETTSAAVEITVSTDKEDVAAELEESLKETADETLENNDVEAEVETDNVALARREEARQLGITPGKLNLIQKLQALDPAIKVEDYKSSSVKDIQKKTKELRNLNKNNDATTDNGTNTETNADSSTNTNTETNADTSTNVVNEEKTVSQKSVESYVAPAGKTEKNSNYSNNNGSVKKEENSNANKQKDTTTVTETQNNSNNVKSQGNSNSSKSENSSKGNSSSESKGNSKDKGKNN